MPFILALVILILLLLLWFLRGGSKQPSGGFGTPIEDPTFQPIERPQSGFIDPPRQKVDIRVQRNPQGVPVDLTIGQRDLRLGPAEQAAWNGGPATGENSVKVEVRFSPRDTPFGGSSFQSARSGAALSGRAMRSSASGQRKYTLLATTPDGYLLTKTATLTPTVEGGDYEAFNLPAPPEGGYGTPIEDPNFVEIDRPPAVDVPPSREVKITVVGREGAIVDVLVEPEEVMIGLFEQVEWTTGGATDSTLGAKLEIRFAPNSTPFNGDMFTTARGGRLFSGLPQVAAQTFTYKVLVTTTDGLFQVRERDARVTITT
jgi:hypothetical protein